VKHTHKNESGFTLIELLVVIVIIGILAAIALPNFIKARNKAREAEVKSNVHAIQIALERYAVDTGGIYPPFLVGAEKDSNVIKCHIDLGGNGVSQFPVHGDTPFAKTADPLLAIGPDNIRIIMDPLIQFGYLSEFPVNPFARRDTGMWNSSSINNTGMTGVYPYGGLHGDKMFDLGFGWGDTPQTDYVLYTTEAIEETEAQSDPDVYSDPDLDSPGNFYYHPIFNDLIPVYFHYAANYAAVELDMAGGWANIGIASDEAAGYLLYGYGAAGDRDSLVEGGLDYFNRMPERTALPDDSQVDDFLPDGDVLDTSVGLGNQQRGETTGYPSQEYDPWTGAFADGINPQEPGIIDQYRKSGADGVLDWVIIEVSSGVDIKSDTTKDQLEFAT
jgi:prepilin-type N-terminal cleavage/methylation domain-containing protein